METCCCSASCGCSCSSCACDRADWAEERVLAGPTDRTWANYESGKGLRKHYADQCCKHGEERPHTPKAIKEDGGLWQHVVSDLKNI